MSLPQKVISHLPDVQKPSRYYPVEINIVRKRKKNLQVALIFPDLYEVGMSHYGLHLLYQMGNRLPGVQIERAFAPWKDMGKLMKEKGIPLYGLESFCPVKAMDAIAFTVPSELNFTNILYCLDLAGLSLRREERKATDPIVIAGGIGIANPAPLEPFMDGFAFGDGEKLFVTFLEILQKYREKGEVLEALSTQEGFYIPGISQGPTKRVFIKDLNTLPRYSRPIVSALATIHARLNVEIMRGCSRACRFCQAGYWYRPIREMDEARIIKTLERGIQETGAKEINLFSLSSADYTQIGSLVDFCKTYGRLHKVAFSLPSTRADRVSLALLEKLSAVKKFGLTLAPEAGSERLRRVINKQLSQEDILHAADRAKQSGWRKIKLYFMIGLPTESKQDLKELVELVQAILKKGIQQVTCHIGNFIPKPHTPFQWAPFAGMEYLYQAQRFLRKNLSHRRVILKWVKPEESLVEAWLARGDEGTGYLLEEAFRQGEIFTSWREGFHQEVWLSLLSRASKALKGFGKNEPLPWEKYVDPGILKAYFWKEWMRSLKEKETLDCRRAGCTGCGIPGLPRDNVYAHHLPTQKALSSLKPEVYHRYRLHFTKQGRSVYLSYTDYINFIMTLLRKNGVVLRYTQGYAPHPKVITTGALPVGFPSQDEVLEVEVAEGSEKGLEKFKACQGIRLAKWEPCPEDAPPLTQVVRGYEVKLGLLNGFVQSPDMELNKTASGYRLIWYTLQPPWKKLLPLKPYKWKTLLA